MRFLFWNTYKNPSINDLLVKLVVDYQMNFVALAEYSDDKKSLIDILTKETGLKYQAIDTIGCNRISIISNLDSLEPGYQSEYCTTQIIDSRLIIVSVHLPSKLHGEFRRREGVARDIANEIDSMERKLGIGSTILIGDINSNPYEYICLGADAFHGIPIFQESERQFRTISGHEYKMFYNPTWRFLGSADEPFGTYYYASGDVECTYWNIYDQVLIRPCLKKRFVDKNLQIITKVREIDLLDKRGHPDRKISDHLPITFEMED